MDVEYTFYPTISNQSNAEKKSLRIQDNDWPAGYHAEYFIYEEENVCLLKVDNITQNLTSTFYIVNINEGIDSKMTLLDSMGVKRVYQRVAGSALL